jgi:hypothetical protein
LNKFSEAVEAVGWIRTNGPFCGMSKQLEEERGSWVIKEKCIVATGKHADGITPKLGV